MSNNRKSVFVLLLQKAASLFVRVRFRNIAKEYFYFYRDTYVCKWLQTRYFFKDYMLRKKYKVVSFEGEFGAELMFALPFAYWHFKNGTLLKTRSFPLTKEMYFFSPDHEEVFTERTNEGNYNYEIPRILYSHDYNMEKWLQVPLKEMYKNDVYCFPKPLLVIANRYNTEWDGPPISFLNLSQLDFIVAALKDHYTLVYNRPQPKNIVGDNSEVYDLNEFEWLKREHPEVLVIEDLYEKNKIRARNFNHFQLSLYANCERFISVHGGTATLASYFGGTNIIYSVRGGEHHFGCYAKLFPQLSGAKIIHAKNEMDLKQSITEQFLLKQLNGDK